MRNGFGLSMLCVCLTAWSGGAAETVLRCDFAPNALDGWRLGGFAESVPVDGGHALRVVAKPGERHRKAAFPIDIRPYAGKVLRMRCRIKYGGVEKPPQPYNGVKFMLSYRRAGGGMAYRHGPGRHGDADWFDDEYYAVVDADAETDGLLSLGLEEAAGTVWFAELSVEALTTAELYPPVASPDHRAEYTVRVTGDVRRRGAMSPSRFGKDTLPTDLPDLRAWGANLIRWQLIRNWGKTDSDRDEEEYLDWVRARIPETRQVLDKAEELGMKVAVDLHVAPGGRKAGGEMNMFREERFAKAFAEAWRLLATAFKGHPALYGYNLINEPVQQPGARADYLALQYEVARIVRAIDPETPIVVESNQWTAPEAFAYLGALPLKDVIYQVHMYKPMAYTHQGVGGQALMADAYPGWLGNEHWDREHLRRVLQPVRDFQLRHGARIYVGEFSVIRWAAGGERYLRDCLEIFEEYGWDWSYHAFREWSGWSVEHEGPRDAERRVDTTPRKDVLLEYLARNREPDA